MTFNLRDIVSTTLRNRESGGNIYLPGAIERIVAGISTRSFETTDELVDALIRAVEAEEMHLDRDRFKFEAMCLPGWMEWADQVRLAA